MAIVQRADLTNLNLTAGGAGSANLITPSFAEDVIKAAVESSIALQMFPLRKVPTGQMSIPVLSAFPNAYWVAETPLTGVAATDAADTKKKTTSPAWQGAVLKLAELAAIVPIPLAILEDVAGSGTDLWNEIRPLVGQAIAMKVDGTVFFGAATGNFIKPSAFPDGLVRQAITAGNTNAAGVAGADIIGAANGALSDVEASGFDPDFWLADRSFRGLLRGLAGDDGHPVYLSAYRSDSRVDEFFGVPIGYAHPGTGGNWDSTVAEALTGDRSAVIMGVSTEGMRVDLLREAMIDVSATMSGAPQTMLNLAQQNMVALRMSFRVAWTTAVPATVNGAGGVPFSIIAPPT